MSEEKHSAGRSARVHWDPQGPAQIRLAYKHTVTPNWELQGPGLPSPAHSGSQSKGSLNHDKEPCLLTPYLSNLSTPQGPSSEQDNTCLIQSGGLLVSSHCCPLRDPFCFPRAPRQAPPEHALHGCEPRVILQLLSQRERERD